MVWSARGTQASRRSLTVLVLALCVCAIVTMYLLHRWSQLRPITRRLLPASYGVLYTGAGYPVLQVKDFSADDLSAFARSDARWLDVTGQPTAEPPVPCAGHAIRMSQEGHTVGWVEEGPPITLHRYPLETYRYVLWHRDGTLRHIPFHDTPIAEDSPSAREIVDFTCLDHGPVIGSGARAYALDGRLLSLPHSGPGEFGAHNSLISLDPRYLVISRYRTMPRIWYVQGSEEIDGVTRIYDTRQQRVVHQFPERGGGHSGNILTYKNRFLVMYDDGPVLLLEEGHPTQTAGNVKTHWFRSDDGTVWAIHDGKIACLQWHKGPMRLNSTGITVPFDPRFGSSSISTVAVLPAAVWDCGTLIASPETRRLMGDQHAEWQEQLLQRLYIHATITREVRRLTLYRYGKPVGHFTVKFPPHHVGYCMERIAFSPDGRYLAWVIDVGIGKQLYVFETGIRGNASR